MCHDATTLLAVHFPYAAPRPSSCSAKLVISPLTTLLTYTSGLTPAALLEAVNLPTTFPLLTKDSLAVRRGEGVDCGTVRAGKPNACKADKPADCSICCCPTPPLQAAAAGDSDSQRVYRREVQVQQVVLVGAKLLTGNSSYHPTARKALLRSLANIVAPTSAGRRLLADAAVESLGEWLAGVGRRVAARWLCKLAVLARSPSCVPVPSQAPDLLPRLPLPPPPGPSLSAVQHAA